MLEILCLCLCLYCVDDFDVLYVIWFELDVYCYIGGELVMW